MIEFFLVYTLHTGVKTQNVVIPFKTNTECVQAAKDIAKTSGIIEDLHCEARKKH